MYIGSCGNHEQEKCYEESHKRYDYDKHLEHPVDLGKRLNNEVFLKHNDSSVCYCCLNSADNLPFLVRRDAIFKFYEAFLFRNAIWKSITGCVIYKILATVGENLPSLLE